MEKFFEAGTLTDEELVVGAAHRDDARRRCFRSCARRRLLNIGVQPLLDAILAYLPSPADRPFTGVDKSGAEVAREADEKKPAAAFVWKTIADPFAGRITMFRVVSGALKADSTVHNKTRDAAERFGHLAAAAGEDADAACRRSRPAISARSRS